MTNAAISRMIETIEELSEKKVSLEPIQDQKFLDLIKKTSTVFVNKDYALITSNMHDPVCKQVIHVIKAERNRIDYYKVSDQVMRYIKTHDASNTHHSIQKHMRPVEISTDKQDMFYVLIEAAKNRNAADIRIIFSADNSDHEARIFFRIHGQLVRQKQFSYSGKALLGMMRAAINYDATTKGGDATKQFDESRPNDASIPVRLSDGTEISIRCGSMPGVNKTISVSLRILAVGTISKTITLEQLGFLPDQVALIKEALLSPYGAIIFSGPTGSGKTTSIAAGLELIDDTRSTITLENPVENKINKPAIIQCPVNEENPDLTWERLLRSALRNDPDVIMVGEIRDKFVAKTATRAASTGHLVLTTLHVNTSLEIPAALKYYDLSPLEIAERTFLRLLCAQRLVPKLCSHCRIPLKDYDVNTSQVNRLKKYFSIFKDSVFIGNPAGCRHCNFQGITGRALIAEVLKMDTKGREFIRNQDTDAWFRYLISKGWRDMKYHAEKLVQEGIICPIKAETEVSTPFGVDSQEDDFSYSDLRNQLHV